jgi:hypothetical protein
LAYNNFEELIEITFPSQSRNTEELVAKGLIAPVFKKTESLQKTMIGPFPVESSNETA